MMDKSNLSKASQGGNASPPGFRGRMSPTLIGWLIVLAICVIFFFRNSENTKLDFLFVTTHNKTRYLVIACIAIGVVLDRLFSMWWRKRRRANLEAKLEAQR